MLARNGIDPENLSEAQIAGFMQQSLAGQQRAIQAYHDTVGRRKQSPQQVEDVGSSHTKEGDLSQHGDAMKPSWSPSDAELIYKTVKRTKRDPISI